MWVPVNPFHAVTLQKYFMHIRVKSGNVGVLKNENSRTVKLNEEPDRKQKKTVTLKDF